MDALWRPGRAGALHARAASRRNSTRARARRSADAGERRDDLAHAVELAREGVPLNVIQRQLGHANLGTTSIYLQGIDTEEIIATVHARRADDVRHRRAPALTKQRQWRERHQGLPPTHLDNAPFHPRSERYDRSPAQRPTRLPLVHSGREPGAAVACRFDEKNQRYRRSTELPDARLVSEAAAVPV
jgi:hypothetical protein